MEDNDDMDWSEEKAVKTLWSELILRSVIYIGVILLTVILEEYFASLKLRGDWWDFLKSCWNNLGEEAYCFLLIILLCCLYVRNLLNKTGCESRQLIFGISTSVIISSLVLCGCVILLELPYDYCLMIIIIGASVVGCTIIRYKFDDDD